MISFLCSPWMDVLQALLALGGTFLLAFGLKTIAEARAFNISEPQPLSPRFWWGLGFISLAALPTLLRAFSGGCSPVVATSSPVVGAVIGFISGWGLAELTDFRRRSMQRSAYRNALKAELRSVETFLSGSVFLFSIEVQKWSDAIAEIRWQATEGKTRPWLRDRLKAFAPEEIEAFLDASDEQLERALAAKSKKNEANYGIAVPVPILDSILSGQGSTLSREELELLSELRRQLYTIEKVSDRFDRLPVNQVRDWSAYQRQLVWALGCVREAITKIDQPRHSKPAFDLV